MGEPSLSQVGLRIYLRIRWVRFRRRLRDVVTEPTAIYAGLFLISVAVVFAVSWAIGLYDEDFLGNVLVEAHGMLFDILVLGIVFSFILKLGQNRLDRRNYQDAIRDFAGWDDPGAVRRIVGHVKRLNRLGVSAIDLRDCILKDAPLGPYRTEEKSRPVAIDLHGASLHRADLSGAVLKDADLSEANFHHARLDGTVLERADLSGAKNLSVAQLLKTETLAGARLDPELAEALHRRDASRAAELMASSSAASAEE